MTSRVLSILAGVPVTVSATLLLSVGAYAQTATAPGGGDAQPSSPAADSPSRPTAQPAYPSSDPPRGTTPQQRQQQGNVGAARANTVTCNQEEELARSECLRRDMTDDDDRPAGVTQSMQQRRQQAQQQSEATNVASDADPGSDQARGRTRTASSDLPSSDNAENRSQETRESQPSDAEANNASDTLGSER